MAAAVAQTSLDVAINSLPNIKSTIPQADAVIRRILEDGKGVVWKNMGYTWRKLRVVSESQWNARSEEFKKMMMYPADDADGNGGRLTPRQVKRVLWLTEFILTNCALHSTVYAYGTMIKIKHCSNTDMERRFRDRKDRTICNTVSASDIRSYYDYYHVHEHCWEWEDCGFFIRPIDWYLEEVDEDDDVELYSVIDPSYRKSRSSTEEPTTATQLLETKEMVQASDISQHFDETIKRMAAETGQSSTPTQTLWIGDLILSDKDSEEIENQFGVAIAPLVELDDADIAEKLEVICKERKIKMDEWFTNKQKNRIWIKRTIVHGDLWQQKTCRLESLVRYMKLYPSMASRPDILAELRELWSFVMSSCTIYHGDLEVCWTTSICASWEADRHELEEEQFFDCESFINRLQDEKSESSPRLKDCESLHLTYGTASMNCDPIEDFSST